jgi:chromosome segregation ATPase
LFSEGKTPVQVVVRLDIPADVVQSMYREFWELTGMHKLNVIYEEKKDSLPSLLKLHEIVEEQRMGENEVVNVLKLANNNELRDLQEKVEYFRNQIRNLELEKDKCTNDVLVLTRRIDELRETVNAYDASLNEKREEIAVLNREQKRLDNLVINNRDNKNNDDSDTEVIYSSGDWFDFR